MILLRDLSVLWSLIHTLIMFGLLYESRYSQKKTLTLTSLTMVPLGLVNFVFFVLYGPEKAIILVFLTLSIPSLIFFWILARHRDGRFVFTFCLVDTIVLEILTITSIIAQYIPGDGYLFLFLSRLFIYPLLELVILKFRKAYQEIQEYTPKGWGRFAVIGVTFYIAIGIGISFPTYITDRPEYFPSVILLFILMPISYINIFATLYQQWEMHKLAETEHLTQIQMTNMRAKLKEFSIAEETARQERHNFRHKMQTIMALLEKEKITELKDLIQEYYDATPTIQIKNYCEHAIIDSVLCSYLHHAEQTKIHVVTKLDFPKQLPVNESDLAMTFANTIENAIHACEKLEPENRFIEINVVTTPCFMIQIKNSFNGDIIFDQDGIPISPKKDHGLGTRSIVSFCEKNHAFYEFKAEEDTFFTRIIFR